MVGHHPAMFGGHWSSASGNIKHLIFLGPHKSYNRTKSGGQRHCASENKMVIVCHVILEDCVIKALKSVITIFSNPHGMSHSHVRNFTIKVASTKTFACVASSLILVTTSCVTNDEIYAKKIVGPSKNGDRK